ncbi:MAG: hypothetical protein HY761_00865 [Candidatus Omnitrophica bacterium]|nr:hypothetical protein [Candidatus Omnitrophota bacterium]
MSKITVFTIILVLFAGLGFCEEMKKNQYNEDWTYRQESDKPKTNPYSGEWQTVPGEKNIKYNPYREDWTYEQEADKPRYNPYSGEWIDINPDEDMRAQSELKEKKEEKDKSTTGNSSGSETKKNEE